MNRWLVAFISLIVSAIFAVAVYFLPDSITLFWAIVIAVMTFIISFVFIELLKHTKRIDESDINSKYTHFNKYGISNYYNDFAEISFTNCFLRAKSIKIVLLYSKSTISGNITYLREFVNKPGTSLEIIILKNDKYSESFKYVSNKFGYSEDQLSEKLEELKNTISHDLLPYKGKKSSIKLYCTDIIPMYTLYLFDNYAYVTLYRTTPQRTTLIPCFRVEKTKESSFFTFVTNDFNELKMRSEEIGLS